MNDQTLMPFGKYKNTPMANVPDSYLLWLYNRIMMKSESGQPLNQDESRILSYIEDYGVENLNKD
ncbi:DUF3820 family protein [Cyclobacterium sp.]|uniref:putative quorum-sensing-regulated virulence factor n=1 Tax=Cyclobacterium sp. TaxID=1966343 RepID=UPI0019B771C5|nr:DUF3820 family protein [Cyclobacterium sp.]MBD3627622.1 DUF3820 family protein [Cyclobacterium sp.]